MIDLAPILKKAIDSQSLTIYGASQLVCAETDEDLKTVHDRLSRWTKRSPKWWGLLVITLDALGYQITITKK